MKSSELVSIYKKYSNSQLPITISIDPENPRANADKWVLDRYGNFCSLGDQFERDKRLVFPILADMPIRIDEEEEISFSWIKIGKVGEIKLNKTEPFNIEGPNYRKLLQIIKQKYYQFRNELEMELIKASQFRFACINNITFFMDPVLTLINLFKEDIKKHEIPKGVRFDKILQIDNQERWTKHLKNSELIYLKETKEGKKAYPTDTMKTYMERYSDQEFSFEIKCMGKIIIHEYNAISKYNPILKSYVKFANALYEASFERMKPVKITAETWVDKIFARRYGKPQNRETLRVRYPIELENSGLITEDNGMYSPKVDIYESYVKEIETHLSEKYPVTLETWGDIIA